MASLEQAIQRVNKLKTMAETLIGANGENNKLIQNKLAVIQNRISKLSELRESLKNRFNLLSSQTADIQRLVSQTQGLEVLESKLQALQAQISGVTNLDLSDLDKTITELEQLVRQPSNGSSDSGSGTSTGIGRQQVIVRPTRAVSRIRGRQPSPPGVPQIQSTTTTTSGESDSSGSGSDSLQQGGFRYDSIAKSKSKTRQNRKRNTQSVSKTRSKARSRGMSIRRKKQR